MEGKVNVFYGKGLFKAAFAVGAGLTVGKYVGGMLNGAISGVIDIPIRIMAENGNEAAQKLCEKTYIKYDKPE